MLIFWNSEEVWIVVAEIMVRLVWDGLVSLPTEHASSVTHRFLLSDQKISIVDFLQSIDRPSVDT